MQATVSVKKVFGDWPIKKLSTMLVNLNLAAANVLDANSRVKRKVKEKKVLWCHNIASTKHSGNVTKSKPGCWTLCACVQACESVLAFAPGTGSPGQRFTVPEMFFSSSGWKPIFSLMTGTYHTIVIAVSAHPPFCVRWWQRGDVPSLLSSGLVARVSNLCIEESADQASTCCWGLVEGELRQCKLSYVRWGGWEDYLIKKVTCT